MDADAIVKAMEEAGCYVGWLKGEGDNADIGAFGSPEAWTRFRGVPLEEVERLVDGLTAEDALTKHTAYRTGFNHAKQMMLVELRHLRGGNT